VARRRSWEQNSVATSPRPEGGRSPG
jgi:hypothetical protein